MVGANQNMTNVFLKEEMQQGETKGFSLVPPSELAQLRLIRLYTDGRDGVESEIHFG